MRVYLDSLGCRLNSAETEDLARRFAGAGHSIIGEAATADIILLNTCAVTAQAVRKSRHLVHTLHRMNPEAGIAVIGCWATDEADIIGSIPGVRWVIPNVDKAHALELITGESAHPVSWAPGRWGHTRAFLGVQDGCDNTCTFCVTRMLRGPARSRSLGEVVALAQNLEAHGAQEIVLTGVCLGAYGQDLGMAHGLSVLVQTVLQETRTPRVRLSSVEPWDVDAALLSVWQNQRLCRQLHLPLQAGSERVLRRMGRRYTPADYASLVQQARMIAPEIAITTDVIAGFPGETDGEFEQSKTFIEEMAFARLHVFPFSARPGTPAARLPDSIVHPVRETRAKELRELGERLARSYRRQFIGQTLNVLWEKRQPDGWIGLSDNYLSIFLRSEAELYNRITKVEVCEDLEQHLLAR